MADKSSIKFVKNYRQPGESIESISVDREGKITVETTEGEFYSTTVDRLYFRLWDEMIYGQAVMREGNGY